VEKAVEKKSSRKNKTKGTQAIQSSSAKERLGEEKENGFSYLIFSLLRIVML